MLSPFDVCLAAFVGACVGVVFGIIFHTIKYWRSKK